MKTSEIQSIYDKMSGLKGKKLPIKMSFVVSRNLRKMEEIVKDISDKRSELLEKYGEKQEDGTLNVSESGSVKIEDPDAFTSEMKDLLNADVEITLDTVTLADVEKCDTDGYDKLTVDEVSALEGMMVEENV